MSPSRLVLAVAGASVLCACGPPRIDATNSKALVKSLDRIEHRLDPDEMAAFQDALEYLANDDGTTRDPELMADILPSFAPLDGMSAVETIHHAWHTRVTRTEARICDLEARHEASKGAREAIAGVVLSDTLLYPADSGALERPLIEVMVENRSRQRLYGIGLQVSLRHRDELEPMVVEEVDCQFGSGFPPHRRTRCRAELNDKEWLSATQLGRDAVLLCGVDRIDGRRGRVIAISSYGPTEEYLHDALKAQLESLLESEPKRPKR
jgi:hypothetical protein